MDASESLSCENNNSSLFSAVPDSSNMYQNKDSNLISEQDQDDLAWKDDFNYTKDVLPAK